MRIIPAIDIIDGKCVRLTQGDYKRKKIYNEDPLDAARLFEDAGLKYLHVVDLDGAKSNHIVNWPVLERLAARSSLRIDFGGGVKSEKDVRIAFECGACQVTAGSVAARNPQLFLEWLQRYSAEKIILGADARQGRIMTDGWRESAGLDVESFIDSLAGRGARYVICTDVGRDGMLQGPAFDLYKRILQNSPQLKLIASGGISTLGELRRLRDMGLEGAIIGKALYENRIRLDELREF
ncbi:MAG TPA: 1-(5-phosphoribosyl)-5-[(5-phosphoribosylamino)methylideneamino]imidazole-4-carboxamide isomerase [Caldithrix abyssi]|uniref:1-(5-phosphoribosyl)-5-[(5-phosphoribosylamino)methylideneamino] imidazole-4-carboxamide isomerase n=1 Tax=Caldithrix abyssi TaxID=187145 RepID=A0A7V5VF89_CALAY|nr:1-(5-phosphoribosyl)-5-[(5-phosphoribosylamino)methylideneamino]imidazole-4-carboxamide isomerase [Caldithrix abyssi]